MGSHRGGSRRSINKTANAQGGASVMKLRHREVATSADKGPQRPEPKSPSLSSNESSNAMKSPNLPSTTTNSNDGESHTSHSDIEPPHVKQERIIIEPSHWIKAAPKIMSLFPNGKLTAKLINNNIHALATDSAFFRQAQDSRLKTQNTFPHLFVTSG